MSPDPCADPVKILHALCRDLGSRRVEYPFLEWGIVRITGDMGINLRYPTWPKKFPSKKNKKCNEAPSAAKRRFFIRFQARIPGPPGPGILGGVKIFWGGPARIYISRHPQPPAKYIRFSGISQSLYTRIMKINNWTGCLDLGYNGTMTSIYKNGLDLTYLRGQVIALMKLNANIQTTINKLEEEIKEKEGENEK